MKTGPYKKHQTCDALSVHMAIRSKAMVGAWIDPTQQQQPACYWHISGVSLMNTCPEATLLGSSSPLSFSPTGSLFVWETPLFKSASVVSGLVFLSTKETHSQSLKTVIIQFFSWHNTLIKTFLLLEVWAWLSLFEINSVCILHSYDVEITFLSKTLLNIENVPDLDQHMTSLYSQAQALFRWSFKIGLQGLFFKNAFLNLLLLF